MSRGEIDPSWPTPRRSVHATTSRGRVGNAWWSPASAAARPDGRCVVLALPAPNNGLVRNIWTYEIVLRRNDDAVARPAWSMAASPVGLPGLADPDRRGVIATSKVVIGSGVRRSKLIVPERRWPTFRCDVLPGLVAEVCARSEAEMARAALLSRCSAVFPGGSSPRPASAHGALPR